MSQPFIYFYALSAIIIFGAFNVATRKNLVHAALFLCLTFLGVAGIFIMLNAEFLAAVQILIYAGAVTILMLFAIMLTKNISGKEIVSHNRQVPIVLIVTLVLAILMVGILIRPVDIGGTEPLGPNDKWSVKLETGLSELRVDEPNIALIGKSLMSTYTLAFWIMSIILTIAMIGSLIIARKD